VQAPRVVNSGSVTAIADEGRSGYVEVTSAHRTILERGSVVSAAGGAGHADAGEVLVHSYQGGTTVASGATVDVSGGQAGGHGGFAEVSGKNLAVHGELKGDTAHGYKSASLLIDPSTSSSRASAPTTARSTTAR
jgi:hypothetical protein